MAISLKKLTVENEVAPVGVKTKTPRFSWVLSSDKNGVKQLGYRIVVHEWPHSEVWDTGFVESDETVNIEYRGATPSVDTQYYVSVEIKTTDGDISAETTFRTGLFDRQAPEIAWIRPSVPEKEYKFSPYFRREFALKSDEIAYATIYISSRGWYDLYLNGKSLCGDAVLEPACSPDNHYSHLKAYDITDTLRKGHNAVGVHLGNGYSTNFRFANAYRCGKRLWALISIVYTDGEYQHIWTDENWKWSTSPVIFDHIYDGEWYDARLEKIGWNKVGYNDSSWDNAVRSDRHEVLRPLFTPSVKILGTREPVSIKSLGNNRYIYDFGFNGSGVVKFSVTGDPGSEIKLLHAENVLPNGALQTWTNRNAECIDRYILKGDGVETYAPKFTYHCFRYVEFTVIGNAEIVSAEALVYGSDVFNESNFECSSDMLNRIQQNFVRTLKTNFMAWPTDTGVRDERTPCSMDTQVYEEMAIHNCNIHNYFETWMSKGIAAGGCPDWSGDDITLAWLMFKYYNDIPLVSSIYKDLRGLAVSFYYQHKFDHFEKAFGDWTAPNPTNEYEDSFSSPEETCYAMMYRHMYMLIDIANALGETNDIAIYEKLAAVAREEYMKYYDENTHLFSDGKQTPNLLAIANGIVTGEEKEKVLAALVKSIRENDNSHLDTGIFGTRKLIEVLSESEEGKALVYDILHQTTYPSFGHQIIGRDATTAWEQWYNLSGMFTCSHSMFCGIGVDFYKYFAGIKNVDNCYKKAIIEPIADERLTSVDCKLETIRGLYAVKWQRDDEQFKLECTVPVGCTATVILPNGEKHEVESGNYTFG